MHLTQCLDQASAVGSLPGKLPGQSIREYNFDTCSAGARAQDFSSYFCSCSGPVSDACPSEGHMQVKELPRAFIWSANEGAGLAQILSIFNL